MPIKVKVPVKDDSNPSTPDTSSIKNDNDTPNNNINNQGDNQNQNPNDGQNVNTNHQNQNNTIIHDDNDGDGVKGDDNFKPDGLEQVQIDEDSLFVTEDGNLVNEKGEQIYSKDEYDSIRANSDIIDVSLIEKYSGIQLTDENGEPIQFENNVQGIAKREAYIKEQVEKQAKQDAMREFFEANPVIKDVYNHYKEHNSLDGFKPTVDYKSLELSKDNTEQLESIVLEAEMARGLSQEKAQKRLEYYKADNTLYEEAVDAKEFLAQRVENEIALKQKEEDDAKRDAIKKATEYYGVYYDNNGKEVIVDNEGSLYNTIVTKRQIGDLKIPETGISVKQQDGTIKTFKPRDIFNYVALAVDGKNSQAELDEMKNLSDNTKRLQRFLYNLTGGDLSMLVSQSIADKKVTSVKRTYTSNKQKHVSNSNNANTGNIKIVTPVK